MVIIEHAAQRVFVLITPMNYEALVGCMKWAEDFLPDLIKWVDFLLPAPKTHNIQSKMKNMSKLGKDYCKLLLSVLFIQARL
jgi:hypothetical protein